MLNEEQKRHRLLKSGTYAAVSTAFLLIIIKLYAWITTSSVAMQATLMDSVLDALVSLLNLLAVRHSLRPADREHRFGHGKIEAIAGLGQATFITGSAIFVLLEAGRRMINPLPLKHSMLGVGVMIFSITLTSLLVAYQRYVVRKTESQAIAADLVHYSSDLLINLGVLISFGLRYWVNFSRIDALFGAIIALYILHTARKVFQKSLDILMDRELPDEEREKIKTILKSHPQVKGFHHLKTRSAGAQRFIQLHLEMDAKLSLQQAHTVTDEIEARILQLFPFAEVIIHQDVWKEASSCLLS